ncbi:MAG TPA: FAD-binding oxidoreductase [Candidatus Binataceae bacterium]|nr:FAD-binding oxidoreductase [Candidatus Binataceae bacterium]
MAAIDLSERFDAVLIGGGIIGSAVAMGLAERGLGVAVADVDLSGRLSSSEKNAGGVRATWWQPVNVALCRASIAYYESLRDEVGFRQKGYLWLYDETTWPQACAHLEMQRSFGHRIETLTAAEVARRVPEIDRLEAIAGATFSPSDGLINPNLLKEHYRARARAAGAQFLDRTLVHAASVDADEVRLQCWQAAAPLSDAGLTRLMTEDGPGAAEPGRLIELRAGAVAITTGAWSDNALRIFGLRNYSESVRRQICLADNRAASFAAYGMIVDTSGVYFHNEGVHILAGYSPPDTPPGHHFTYDGEAFFIDQVWPRMYARMSCCERMRHVTGWAGLYEVSPDRSAIIGRAAPRVFEAHSFSGRGVMQSYGAGQALANLIARGEWGEFDASTLSRERFADNRLVFEELHI